MTARSPRLHRIESSLDRFREAHYWIHMLERHYHQADPFRWYLNAFLKAIKEAPRLLTMELQNEKGFKEWFFSDQRKQLHADPLIARFTQQRDLVVHQRMLLPNSSSWPDLSCSARQRIVPPSKSMSHHQSWRMAPIRWPVSCASTSARWNRQSTRGATFRSARYSSSVSTTRVGFFSVGFLKPLSGFCRERAALLVPRPRGPIQNRDEELEVVFDRPVGHGPSALTDPARAALADETVPVPLGKGGRVAVPSEEPEEHVRGGPVVPRVCAPLVGVTSAPQMSRSPASVSASGSASALPFRSGPANPAAN